jgi:predicted dehydrogenase
MLKETKPDIFFIATHPDTHFEMVKKAVSAGIKVIVCEKPLADSLKKAKKIAAYHKDKKTKIITNHERRYSNNYINVKNIIDKKIYGKLLSVSASLYMGRRKRIIDVMWHDGTHLADIIMYLTGGEIVKNKVSGNLLQKKGTVFITAEIKESKHSVQASLTVTSRKTEWVN